MNALLPLLLLSWDIFKSIFLQYQKLTTLPSRKFHNTSDRDEMRSNEI